MPSKTSTKDASKTFPKPHSAATSKTEPDEDQEYRPDRIVSSPIPPKTSEVVELKPHISAPSYLQSLAELDHPPFQKPVKETRPILIAGPFTLITREDVIKMIAASDADPVDGLKKFLEKLLVQKEIIRNFDLCERGFLVSLLIETVDYAAQRDFSSFKLSLLLSVYLMTHKYFKWYYWSSPVAVWSYFRELMIRLSIEDSPDAQDVFLPDECYDIVTHFHTVYLTNLPLIHIITFGAHRLKLVWPFKKTK